MADDSKLAALRAMNDQIGTDIREGLREALAEQGEHAAKNLASLLMRGDPEEIRSLPDDILHTVGLLAAKALSDALVSLGDLVNSELEEQDVD